MICDFAQVYHIYDIRQFPARYIAILANGLGEDSRIGRAVLGTKADTSTILIAKILDCFNIWLYSNSDPKKRGKEPESYADVFLNVNQDDKTAGFASGEEFEQARMEIIRKSNEKGKT